MSRTTTAGPDLDHGRGDLALRLAAWWSRTRPAAMDVRVDGLEPAPSGFSNETWFVDLSWRETGDDKAHRLVLRRAPGGAAFFDDYDLHLQFDVMKALGAGGMAVPEVYEIEDDPAVLGAPFFTMAFIDGKVASGRRPGFHGHGLFFEASVPERRAMWLAAVEAMAQVHRFDWRSSDLADRFGNPRDAAEAVATQIAQVEQWLTQAASLGPFPVIDRALHWLRQQAPAYSDPGLLWGDARPGNLIYQGNRVAAILDWEMAGIGPAEFDLFYFLLADEVVAELNGVPRLEGLPAREETILAWEAGIGRPVEHRLHAEIFAATRFAALMALVVRLSPPGLDDPRALLTDNAPTRRLEALLSKT